jgi:hypothetical protein
MEGIEKNKPQFYAKYTLPITLIVYKIITQKKANTQNGYATLICPNFYLCHISEQFWPISASNPFLGIKLLEHLVSYPLASNPKV